MFSIFQIVTFCFLILCNFFFQNTYESFLVIFFALIIYILFLFLSRQNFIFFLKYQFNIEMFFYIIFFKAYNTFLRKNKTKNFYFFLFKLKANNNLVFQKNNNLTLKKDVFFKN